ncbi:MAG: ABC transporter substrate-binding protein [Acidimicrobiales bacterium]
MALVLAGAGGVAASSAGTKAKAAKVQTISEIDTTPGLSELAINVTELDTAQQHNLIVSPDDVTGSAAAVQEFAGGTGDQLAGGFDENVTLYQKGLAQTTIVGTVLATNVWVLVSLKGSPYTTLASLAGQNVGISAIGAVSQYGLYYGLDQAGLSPTSLNYVALGGPATELAGLEAGTVKAAVLVAPNLQDAESAGTIQTVYSMTSQPYAANVIAVRNSYLATHQVAVCNYMLALQQAQTKIYSQPNWALAEAANLYGSSTSAADIKTSVDAFESAGTWPKVNSFPLSLYTSSKAILLDSGFSATGFPTYKQLTSHRPTQIVKVKGKRVREAC